MQRYESYKPSGAEWLGNIPSHWDIFPFKALFKMSTEKNGRQIVGEMLSVSGYRGIEVKQYEFEEQKRSKKELCDYRVVRKGQLVVNTMWLNYAGLGVSSHEGYVSPAYRSYWCDAGLRPLYAHYLMRSHPYIQGYTGQMQGIRPNSLQIQNCDFNKIPILVPTHAEQDRIVTFLDQKTAEINAAIAKKKQLIKLLQEQKSILINQAVTRGLNPDVPMRDSGVEWIGEIPAHWKIAPNRYLFREQNVRSLKGDETHLSMSQRYGLVPAKELAVQTLQSESYDGAKLCKTGDLVQNRLKAHLAVFAVSPCDGLVSPDYSVFRLQDSNHQPVYFERLFKTPVYLSELNRRVRGIVIGFLRLYSEDFNAIPALIPPVEEQQNIVNFINRLNSDFAVMQGKIEDEIKLLVELKSTIVASAVTGQFKV